MNNSYGDIEELTQVENIAHTFTVLCEWPTAREQFKLENMYATTEDILEKILEREGTLDLFSSETSSLFPIFSSNN